MIKRLFFRSLYAVLLLVLVACQGGERTHASAGENLQLKYAQLITDEHSALIGGDYQRVAVDASVYKGLMEMLGVGDKCIDFSDQMKPDVEKIAASKADLLLVSAYEGAELEKYDRLGIPVVKCCDFLEPTAIGRAEWMRYFGRLWGVADKADSLFAEVERNYKTLAQKARKKEESKLPTVFFDTLYGGIWYQPARQSTLGMVVRDAGGQIAFDDNKEGGSLSLSAEQVLIQAGKADYWIIRAYGKEELTLEKLAKMNPVYSQFRAFKEGKVFVCYTDETHFFEETPFRPDWLLKEFQTIFNSGFGETESLRYFCKIK